MALVLSICKCGFKSKGVYKKVCKFFATCGILVVSKCMQTDRAGKELYHLCFVKNKIGEDYTLCVLRHQGVMILAGAYLSGPDRMDLRPDPGGVGVFRRGLHGYSESGFYLLKLRRSKSGQKRDIIRHLPVSAC